VRVRLVDLHGNGTHYVVEDCEAVVVEGPTLRVSRRGGTGSELIAVLDDGAWRLLRPRSARWGAVAVHEDDPA